MNKLDLKFPSSWSDLSVRQLKYVFKLLAGNFSMEEIKLFCLFRWNDISVLARNGAGSYLVSYENPGDNRKSIYVISPVQIAEIFPFLGWLDEMPKMPVRIEKIGFLKALPADFDGVALKKFIMADNLYQGCISVFNDPDSVGKLEELMEMLFSVLYSTRLPFQAFKIKKWMKVAAFYWFSGLKNLLSTRFPDFFHPAISDSGNAEKPDQVEIMNTMIRALTKGDITKEKEVLAMDTWRALAELNAQAKDYAEMNRKFNKH